MSSLYSKSGFSSQPDAHGMYGETLTKVQLEHYRTASGSLCNLLNFIYPILPIWLCPILTITNPCNVLRTVQIYAHELKHQSTSKGIGCANDSKLDALTGILSQTVVTSTTITTAAVDIL